MLNFAALTDEQWDILIALAKDLLAKQETGEGRTA